MAINFPNAPTTGQTTSLDDVTWKFNGVGWAIVPNAGSNLVVITQAVYDALSTTDKNNGSVYLVQG